MDRRFYITTTAPYVNSRAHVGFALEIVQADTIARHRKLAGDDVVFGFGTDEHGLKIYRRATEEGKTAQEYCDEMVAMWSEIKSKLNLSYTNFIRTTDRKHIEAAQELWLRCLKSGDIYKKVYKSKYCVGCELEKTDSELENSKCPIHPNLEVELIDEENYFFRFSRYQEPLLKLYSDNPSFVIPSYRLKEIEKFVKDGLQDFSISRLKKKMPWGVDVPNDPEHVMFVWFDALTFYLSNLGWPDNEENFNKFWPVVQVAGKDNLRQQSAIWQAMLMSAKVPNSKQIFIHGFITSGGQKMSKSLGNVIDPFEYVEKYGVDALRYYLLAEINPTEDSDFTEEKFKDIYNADLANGLGNLVARIAKMAETGMYPIQNEKIQISKDVALKLENFEFDKAIETIWQQIKEADTLINQKEVWKLEGKEKEDVLAGLVNRIRQIAFDLQPFLPETAEKIAKQYSGEKILISKPLFPRLV